MVKLRLDLETLAVESFDAGADEGAPGTIQAHESTCSKQPTCGVASRGPETYDLEIFTRYACCV